MDRKREHKREQGFEACAHTCQHPSNVKIIFQKEGSACKRHAKKTNHPFCNRHCVASPLRDNPIYTRPLTEAELRMVDAGVFTAQVFQGASGPSAHDQGAHDDDNDNFDAGDSAGYQNDDDGNTAMEQLSLSMFHGPREFPNELPSVKSRSTHPRIKPSIRSQLSRPSEVFSSIHQFNPNIASGSRIPHDDDDDGNPIPRGSFQHLNPPFSHRNPGFSPSPSADHSQNVTPGFVKGAPSFVQASSEGPSDYHSSFSSVERGSLPPPFQRAALYQSAAAPLTLRNTLFARSPGMFSSS